MRRRISLAAAQGTMPRQAAVSFPGRRSAVMPRRRDFRSNRAAGQRNTVCGGSIPRWALQACMTMHQRTSELPPAETAGIIDNRNRRIGEFLRSRGFSCVEDPPPQEKGQIFGKCEPL